MNKKKIEEEDKFVLTLEIFCQTFLWETVVTSFNPSSTNILELQDLLGEGGCLPPPPTPPLEIFFSNFLPTGYQKNT